MTDNFKRAETGETLYFDRIVSVLGHDSSNARFQELIEFLNEVPIVSESERLNIYSFDEIGVEFVAMPVVIEHTIFMLNTEGTKNGSLKAYKHDFPAGIQDDDSRLQIVAKLQIANSTLVESNHDNATYLLHDFQLYILFDTDDAESAMSIVEVHLNRKANTVINNRRAR